MAALFRWYDIATQNAADGTWESTGALGSASIALKTQPLTVALLTSSYTYSAAHTIYGQLTNELSTGGGYTNGGQALSGVNLTQAAPVSNLTANNVVWTASGGGIPAFRFAAVYINAVVAGTNKPLLFVIDNNGVDVPATTAPNTLTIVWNVTAIVQITHS